MMFETLGYGLLGNAYPWVKAGHIIFVIFWIAGLFMLPRFFIYHHAAAPGSEEDRLWVERERRLRSIIITPSMIVVWGLGLVLAFHLGLWSEGWFLAKFAVATGLSTFHGWAVGYGKRMAAGYRPASDTALRFMNEIPGVATAIIVILVIVRPF